MNRYRLIRTVASGGMAQVLEGVVQGAGGFERRVAIKRILPQNSADPSLRRMFLEEARLGSKLHHGGIVQITDFGTVDNQEFLVMEFVDGIDARQACKRSPVPEGVALHVVAEIAHALAYLHSLTDEQGRPMAIVHRDVSPQNVLLSWDGDVKLSDFGIALSSLKGEKTATGLVKGKLRYMPPEQARGQPVTPAADVYALGATFEGLLGEDDSDSNPFMRTAEMRALAAQRRGVSQGSARLIAAATDNDPSKRPAAAEVAERAGRLAAECLGRDGRGALRDWLSSLREREQRTSALDDLMGLALVQIGQGDDRVYTVSRAVDASEVATRSDGPARDDEAAVKRRPRRVLFAAGGGTALVAIAVTVMALRSPPPSSEAARPVAESPAREPAVAASLQTAPKTVAPPGPTTPSTQPRPAGRRAPARPKRANTPPAAQTKGAGEGWIAVGGGALVGAEVLLDGRVQGHAPLQRAVPAGRHAITVRDPSSRKNLLEQDIDVRADHTRAAPLRVIRH